MSGQVLALVAQQGGPTLAYSHQIVRLACARSTNEPGRFESVKPIQSTETTIIPLLYLLIGGEFVKTLVIQSVELCEYYNFALRSIAKFSLVFKMQSSKIDHIEIENSF